MASYDLFFDETPEQAEAERRQAADYARQAALRSPGQVAASRASQAASAQNRMAGDLAFAQSPEARARLEQESRNQAVNLTYTGQPNASANLASQGRVNTGYVAGGPGGRTFSQTVQGPNNPMNIPSNVGADIARLGGSFARTLTNPINAVIGDYLPEPVQAAVGGPGYFVDAAIDEGLDRALPGGSGVYGSNIIPGREGTGGDQFYPSETVGTGSYADGYRGVNTPRATPNSELTGGGSGGGLPEGYGQPNRPDQYRTDVLMPQVKALLDAERRQGPSEAEAMLVKATDRAAANALGIAAGARGGAGARERATRQAITSNIAAGSQASQDIAALRAQEDAQRRQRQAEIMTQLGNLATGGDVRDLGYEQSASGERQALANIEAANARFNASQPLGLLDDPFGFLWERATGTPLRGRTV